MEKYVDAMPWKAPNGSRTNKRATVADGLVDSYYKDVRPTYEKFWKVQTNIVNGFLKADGFSTKRATRLSTKIITLIKEKYPNK